MVIDKNLLITFIAILSGLGLSDLILSIHRLLRARKSIKWHWIPIVHAIISFQLMIIYWYNIEVEMKSPLINTSVGFMIWILPMTFLLLIMLAVLPDKSPPSGFKLITWYFKQRRYYYFMYILFVTSLTVNRTFLYEVKSGWFIPLIALSIFAILIYSNKYIIHAIATVLLFCMMFFINFALQQIGYL